MSTEARKLPFIDLLLVGMLLIAYVAAFWPAWLHLVATWYSSEDYSHGFIIVPIVLYALWHKREELLAAPVRPSAYGLPLVIVILILYLVSFLAGIWTLNYLCLILLPAGAVLFLFGRPVLRICLFPLFLLLFMIPVPAQLYASATAPLQIFVSQLTVALIKLGGIPILREGNILHLPERSFQVIQACSGLRSILSLMTLSAVFAYFTLRKNRLRTLLFLASVPVAIAANVIRVLLMVLGYHFFRVDLTEGRGHELFGIGIFVIAIFLLLGIRSVLKRWENHTAAD